MAEERKVAANEIADTEGKASISEKLRAAEGNISRAADEAKARKSEQAKTQKKSESEAKARLEEEERVRLERERAARLVAEQKMAAFEYAENYRKKLMRDKKKTVSAAKQKAKEEKAAAEAEEKRAREAEIAAMLEKERNEARERGNRASALLNRVSKLAVVDGEGNLHVVDKKEPEAAPVEATPAPAPEKIERVVEAPVSYSPADEKIDGRIYISDDITDGDGESAVASVVTEEDGRLILNITDERDDRMVVEVFDGDEETMARDYKRFVKSQAAAAEAYNKEMKRMMEAYEALLNLANPKPDAEAAEPVAEEVAEEPVAVEPASEPAVAVAEQEAAPAKPEPEIVEAPIPAPVAVAVVEEPIAEEPAPVAEPAPVEPVAEPVAEEETPVIEEAVAEPVAEPAAEPEKKEKKEKEKPEKVKKAKEVKEPEDEEPSVEAAAVVAVDEGIVAELRAIAEKVDSVKSLKRYLAKVNKAEKRISREVLRLNKKLETPDVNEAPATVVEKLVLLSDLLEIKSDALAAATRIVAKKFAKRLKAELTALIDEYNRTASSYAAMTGEQLTRVSGFLPKYIAEGTGVAVIPKLTYSEKYVEVNEEDKAANASYVFVFPNINDIAEGGTLTATPDVKTTDGEEENSLAKRIIITSPYTNEELLDTASVYNARELKRAAAKVKKAYKKLDREVALIEKKRQAAVEECDERESLKMMVEEITVRRQKVEITATLLGYCRDVRVKKLTAFVKAEMIEAMAEYNKSIDRYNNVTGESLTRAAAYMADEILEGKPAPRLAKLAYYRELVETVGDTVKVIGRKDKKKALPTTSCTFIFGTTPIVTAGPVGAPAAPAMPALQAQIVPPTSADAQPAVVLSPAPAPVAAPAPAPAPVVIPAVVDEPTPIISISDITAPAPVEAPAPKAEPEVVVAEPTVDEFDEGELAAMDQREFKKLVARNEKKIRAYQKKLEAHDKAKSRSAGPDRAALVIDCIEDLRCIIGTRCEVLELCVHVKDTKATNLNRASLLSDIARYNEYVSEYNLNARELIPAASTEMVDLILAEKPYKKLPKVVRNAKKTTAKAAPADNSLAEYVRANTAEIAARHDEYKKLTKKVKRAKGDGQKASLLVQCINIRVANVNKLVEQLDRCVAAKHTKLRKSTVKALNAEIKAYNSVAEEYTKLSGRVVVLADPKLPRTVINGKPYAKLLAVSDAGIAAGRLQDNTAAGGRSFADSVRITEVRTETEAKCEEQKKKSLAAITDELDFFVDKLYSKRKALGFNFTGVKASARRKIAKITSKMATLERRAKKAVKFEALDNARYYEAVLTDVSSLKLKRESDRNELREIQHRIAELLNKRDEKNVELINHYSGTDKDVLKEQKRSHREVRFKAERKTFNSLRKIDKSLKKRYDNGEIDAYKPDRIHTAMHEMIEAKGEIAVCSARLKEAHKTKLTKHQREMVKKERRGWQKKYDEAHKRLKNNLKTNVLSHMVPIGILLLVLVAGAIAVVLAWPTITAWLASFGITI